MNPWPMFFTLLPHASFTLTQTLTAVKYYEVDITPTSIFFFAFDPGYAQIAFGDEDPQPLTLDGGPPELAAQGDGIAIPDSVAASFTAPVTDGIAVPGDLDSGAIVYLVNSTDKTVTVVQRPESGTSQEHTRIIEGNQSLWLTISGTTRTPGTISIDDGRIHVNGTGVASFLA
jgi:hypothetical protein